MKITFLGTGYSCDPQRRNLSILVEENNRSHLLDCGFNSANGYLSRFADSTSLDSLWVSHFHGDHFFGIPHLILHFYMQQRTKPLTVISGMGGEDIILQAIKLAYPELSKKLPFSIDFVELTSGSSSKINGLAWQCAPVTHSQSSFGLQLSNANHSLYYSGDGRATEQSRALMRGCNLVIHEAYSLEPGDPNHFSVAECYELKESLKIDKLAIVHLDSKTRQAVSTNNEGMAEIKAANLFIPEDDTEIDL